MTEKPFMRQNGQIAPHVAASSAVLQSDYVAHPSHYTQGAIECIDALEAALSREEFIGFLRGNVIKYQWRLRHKGRAVEDVKKSIWYAERLAKTLAAEDRPRAQGGDGQ